MTAALDDEDQHQRRTLSGVALVTGSSRGIGEAIARRLAGSGMYVVVHARQDVEGSARVASSIGGSHLLADLRDEGQCQRLVAGCLDRLGRLDVLVNSAGISRSIPHEDLISATPAVWRDTLDLNLIAPWVLTAAATPALRTSAGEGGPACVLNISSHAGVRPKGASIPYAVSKAALNHMTRLLAAALGPVVRVNALAPGLVDTNSTRDAEAAHRLWAEVSVMRRPARPVEVADMAFALIANPYVTGEVVLLDGGLGLR